MELTSVKRSLTEADSLCRSVVRWRSDEVRAATEGCNLDLATADCDELALQFLPKLTAVEQLERRVR